MSTPASVSEAPSPTQQKIEAVAKTEVQAVEPKPELIDLTDRDTIIWLLYNEVRWIKKERKEGYKTIFWFERCPRLIELLERWQSPEPIQVDVRRWLQAERLFNSAVKDRF